MVERRTQAVDALRSIVSEVEADASRLIAHINDVVVPDLRRSSARGMRAAAEQLGRMADHLDRGAVRASPAHSPEFTATETSTGR